MPALTMGSWSNIQLPALPWRRQRSTSKPTSPSATPSTLATTTHQNDTDSPTIVAPIPQRLLRLPNLSLPTVFDNGYFGMARSLDNLLPPTPDSNKSVSSADDDFPSFPDTPESPEGEENTAITTSSTEGRQLSIPSITPSSSISSNSTSAPTDTTMPYVTPTSPVGTISASSPAFSILQHSFSPSSINSATPIGPSLPSPSAALMFNYDSNTSLDALPSVPRHKSNFRPKMVTPQSSYQRHTGSASLDNLFQNAPGVITVQPPTPDKSIVNSKRVRAQRTTTFTTVVPGSDSQSHSSDDGEVAPEQLQPQRRGCVSSPIGEGGINMLAMGRKRGEMMRHAVSMDAASPTSPNPRITSTPVSPALAHCATAPIMLVTGASPLSSAVTSPVTPQPPSDSASSRPLAARKFHQAIVTGQPNVLRLNMDAIKRARSASPTAPASASAANTVEASSSLFLTPASATPEYDGRPKFNTIGPSSVQFVRKKSGELVKPALRTSRTYCPGESSPLEPTPTSSVSSSSHSQLMMYRRNSAPTTPTPKNVHFDSQLEHVKLFLAEQKPAAVSRSGSPTQYGSTTEEEGPGISWPKRSATAPAEDEEARGKLVVKVVNSEECGCSSSEEAKGPYSKALEKDPEVGVKMESLVLSEDGKTLQGSVVVKNIAYDKRVAARFTLDWWQTTSEVVAKYAESVSAPPPHATSVDTTHDRFVFSVKLADVLSKIDEKTMFVAVRYNSAGHEMWDNNRGANYELKFERVKGVVGVGGARGRGGSSAKPQARFGSPTKGTSPTKEWGSPVRSWSPTKEKRDWSPTKERREWSPTKNNVELQMADLRRGLERAVLEDDGCSGARPVFRRDRDGGALYATPAPTRKAKTLSLPLPPSNQSSPSMSPHPALPSPSSNPPTLNAQLSTRYDLTAALNRKGGSTWNPSKALQDAAGWNPPPLPSSEIKFNGARGRKAVVSNESAASIPFPSRGGSSSPEGQQQRGVPVREASFSTTPVTSSPTAKPPKGVTMALASPRDRDDVFFDDQGFFSADRHPSGVASPAGSFNRGRNHRRGSSYFDGWMESVKLTPPGTPKDVWQGEEPQQATFDQEAVSVEADMRDEAEVAAALLKASSSVGSITGLAVDESLEKEQEKEVLDLLGLANGITPSTSGNDLVTATRSQYVRPPSSEDVVARFNSFPQPASQQSTTIFAPRPQMPAMAYAASMPLSAPGSGESCILSPLGESMASTPSATSASSPSQSPSSPSHSLPTSPSNEMDIASLIRTGRSQSMIDSQDYNCFLDRFCFFTGDLTGAASAGDDATIPRRIHSESEVDSYFAHANPSHSDAGGVYRRTTRSVYSIWGSPPYEDASGAVTPTSTSPGKDITTPRPGTPITIHGSTTTTPVL
ncbi:hypothetical protein FRC04_009240 [Tulasnella sp. 424]|nr:hypothetical protein FRC04_009240 [Tulasnella sp. 424]KAG8973591.1 hypothetical protein FRC05_008660 [Tulasnella sp. 425]